MNKRMALLTATMIGAIIWVVFSFQQSLKPVGTASLTAASGQAGKMVEDFTLKDETDKSVRLSNYKGQIVALVFYASW